jgi:soluble lytic murein transglycosylase-like protein
LAFLPEPAIIQTISMKLRILWVAALILWIAPAGAIHGAVRIGFKGGKRVIYNDGVGSSSREALARSDGWLAARVATPSLYDGMIADAARSSAIDPKLVKSIVLIESAFNPEAVSRKGARGLMQLMPDTAFRYGVRNMFDPAENVSGGARHVAYLLGLYNGDLTRALAAYNAGEAAVARYGGVPPFDETRLYVRKGLAAYYGKSSLGGGFGLPAEKTWGGVKARPVRLTRDAKNRPLITTDLSRPRALKRG